MSQEYHPDFTAWGTITETVRVLAKDIVFFGILLILYVAIAVTPYWLLLDGVDLTNSDEVGGLLTDFQNVWSYLSFLYYFLYAYFFVLVLDRVNAKMNGHSFEDYPYVGRGLRTVIPVVFLYICVTILIMFGFFLLIIPGLIAIAGLYLVIPAKLAENTSVWSAIPRGWELSKGNKLGIWGVILLQLIPSFILASMYMSHLFESVTSTESIEPVFSATFMVTMTLFSGALTIFYMAANGVAYHQIANEKMSDH